MFQKNKMKQPDFLHDIELVQGVYLLTPESRNFENAYLHIREKEGWLLDNNSVSRLPQVEKDEPNWNMWKMRQHSSTRFCNYLKSKNTELSILEIGCGNGWFSNAIKTTCPTANVFGIDINLTELKQASEVFKKENIFWLYANLFEANLPKKYFDVIVLNASVQYFDCFETLIQRLFVMLKEDGEIHIIDSPFYAKEEITQAGSRSLKYFEAADALEMKNYYHHHAWDEVEKYAPQLLYSPNKFRNKFLSVLRIYFSPFYWLAIKKPEA